MHPDEPNQNLTRTLEFTPPILIYMTAEAAAVAAAAAGSFAAGGVWGRVRVPESERAAREEGEPRKAARVERAAQAEGAHVWQEVEGCAYLLGGLKGLLEHTKTNKKGKGKVVDF